MCVSIFRSWLWRLFFGTNETKTFRLFSGIGGFSLGLVDWISRDNSIL